MRSLSLRLVAAVVCGGLLLGGCTTEKAAVELPTHTLAVAESSYAGYLVPQHQQKLEIAVSDLTVKPGEQVEAGTLLSGGTDASRSRAEEAERAASAYRKRIDVAERALDQLRKGRTPSHSRDAAVPSAAVRALEHDIQAALIANERATVQRQRERSRLDPSEPAEAKHLKKDEQLARTEFLNQMQALFENLRAESRTALTEAEASLTSLRATAPWPGSVVVRNDEAWFQSRAATFVFLATEAQVEALSQAENLQLRVKSDAVGTLRLASVAFDEEATSNPQSPRYEMRFDVVTDKEFTPRERSTGSLVVTSDRIAIPEDYMGRDDAGSFVLVGGQRTPVSVVKDAQGQWVLSDDSLRPGDRIEKVGRS